MMISNRNKPFDHLGFIQEYFNVVRVKPTTGLPAKSVKPLIGYVENLGTSVEFIFPPVLYNLIYV